MTTKRILPLALSFFTCIPLVMASFEANASIPKNFPIEVLVPATIGLFLFYTIHSICALFRAGLTGVLQEAFHFRKVFKTYLLVILTFITPLSISSFLGLSTLDFDNPSWRAELVINTLIIYITLELFLIGSLASSTLNSDTRQWIILLALALVLDLLSVNMIKTINNSNAENNHFYITLIAGFAFLSSYLIILFSMIAEKLHETKE